MKDLDDLEEHLQNLKEMKKAACKACEGEGTKKGETWVFLKPLSPKGE